MSATDGEFTTTGPVITEGAFVGRFHADHLVRNHLVARSSWRVTTDDPAVAGAVAKLLGGDPPERQSGGDGAGVMTAARGVHVILDGPGAVSAGLVLRGPGGIVHHCDGARLLSPEAERGRPCGCPTGVVDRKARALSGSGPAPETAVRFRLAADPGLGLFGFASASWKLAEHAPDLVTSLAAIGGGALCELSIQTVEFTTAAGLRLPCWNPAITVTGPWR